MVEWGKEVDPADIEKALEADPSIKAVMIQASETSTGVKHPTKEIAEITGGQYFRAHEGTVGVDQIRAALGKLQESEQKARRVTVHENRFALVLLPGFLLILLEGLLPEAWVVRRRRRDG